MSNDIVDLGDGQDTVSFNEDADGATIYGRGGNDSGITVAFDTSTAYGGEGNDTIWALVLPRLSTAMQATAWRLRVP